MYRHYDIIFRTETGLYLGVIGASGDSPKDAVREALRLGSSEQLVKKASDAGKTFRDAEQAIVVDSGGDFRLPEVFKLKRINTQQVITRKVWTQDEA